MKRYILITAVVLTCAVSCLCLLFSTAKRNLGLSPQKKEFEKFNETKFSRVAITYRYLPENFAPQEIKFEIKDPNTILKIQNAFKIESISAYTLGVREQISFVSYDEKRKNPWDIWKISFYSMEEIRISYDNSKSYTCTVHLADNSFYQVLLQLAFDNNEHLFPNSSIDDVKLCF